MKYTLTAKDVIDSIIEIDRLIDLTCSVYRSKTSTFSVKDKIIARFAPSVIKGW